MSVPTGGKIKLDTWTWGTLEMLIDGWVPKLRFEDDWQSRDISYDYDATLWGISRMIVNTNLMIKADVESWTWDKSILWMIDSGWSTLWLLYSDASKNLYWKPDWWAAVQLN